MGRPAVGGIAAAPHGDRFARRVRPIPRGRSVARGRSWSADCRAPRPAGRALPNRGWRASGRGRNARPRQPQRQRVARVVGEHVVPDPLALEGAARRPAWRGEWRRSRSDAPPIALGRREGARHFECRAKAADQEQIAIAVARARTTVGAARSSAATGSPSAPNRRRAVERRRRFGRAGERQVLLVFRHRQTPRSSALTPR